MRENLTPNFSESDIRDFFKDKPRISYNILWESNTDDIMIYYDSKSRHSPDKVYFRDVRNEVVRIPGLRVINDDPPFYQGYIPLDGTDAVSVLLTVRDWLSSQPEVFFREGWLENS
jgi:hypothetical protein